MIVFTKACSRNSLFHSIVVFGCLLLSTVVLAGPIGMVTGSKTGTYIKFGHDMARVARKEGVEIQVKQSAGSLANIARINSKENAAFGIVQSDVMGFLKRDTELNKRLARKLRVIFPFYLEEVHVLARKEIKTLRDLDGKRVSVGKDGSGTWLTARNLFDILGVQLKREEHLAAEDAIMKVLSNELDAMFYVAGKPVLAFEPLDRMAHAINDPKAQAAINAVHFVPIAESDVFLEYDSETLTRKEYPWLQKDVPTAAVRAVLVGFDFSNNKSSYYRNRCKQLDIFGRAIRNSLNELKNGGGHEKWNQVDLDRDVPGWKRDTCSQSQGQPSPGSSTANDFGKYFNE